MTYPSYLFVDAHEDLAWNMLTFGRDYRRSVNETRQLEKDSIARKYNGDSLLGLAEYREANTALVFSTLFTTPMRANEGEWDTICYRDSQQAYKQCQDQLNVYKRLAGENPQMFTIIDSSGGLRTHTSAWQKALADGTNKPPVGLIYLMEGCDAIRQPSEVEAWYQQGVRLFGLAWQATRYSGGTKEPGPLTPEGVELIHRMEDVGAMLDLSHMDELAVRQTFDQFGGSMFASHSNPYALNRERESNRFLKDDIIIRLAERGGIIGVVPYNLFLDSRWAKGDRKDAVPLVRVVDQIDYICQLVGDADHVGIGSDFDGGVGVECVPAGLQTIADLRGLIPLLHKKGYTNKQVENIFSLNWLEFLISHLPE